MRGRDLWLLFAGLLLAGLFGCLPFLAGVNCDVLLAAPVLLLALPLLAGRYIGADRLERIARALAPPRRPRLGRRSASAARRPAALVPRGGRLIAAALAVRPPPAGLAHS